MLQQPLGLGQIHAADLIQCLPHRHKFPAGPVVKFYAQGRGAAASPVVGAASAQAQQHLAASGLHRVADDLPHPIGGGHLRILSFPHHGQAGGAGHLHHRFAADFGVDRLDVFAVGAGY